MVGRRLVFFPGLDSYSFLHFLIFSPLGAPSCYNGYMGGGEETPGGWSALLLFANKYQRYRVVLALQNIEYIAIKRKIRLYWGEEKNCPKGGQEKRYAGTLWLMVLVYSSRGKRPSAISISSSVGVVLVRLTFLISNSALTFFSIASAMSGLSSRYLTALSLPWAMFSPS